MDFFRNVFHLDLPEQPIPPEQSQAKHPFPKKFNIFELFKKTFYDLMNFFVDVKKFSRKCGDGNPDS